MVVITRHSFSGKDAGRQWCGMIAALFGAGENHIGEDRHFAGQIQHCRMGRVEFSRVGSSWEWSRRTEQHVRTDDRDTYMLVNVRSGHVQLRQSTSPITLGPRTFLFYCASRPYEWQHEDATDVRNIAIPGALLRARLRNLDQFTGRPFPDTVGMWRILSDMMDSSFRQISLIPELASYRLASQLVDLLALSLEAGDRLTLGDVSGRAALYQRALNFIRANLSDKSLNPDMVAGSLGTSVRSLHRIFAENDNTVSDCIRNERLEFALQELQSPAAACLAIAEIAHRCGFRSQAHFAQAFRARYGMSASVWRRSNG